MTASKYGTTTLKPEVDCKNVDNDEALGNSNALNSIFNGVNKNMFRLINTYTCTEAKEACAILKTTHEGTSKVRISSL